MYPKKLVFNKKNNNIFSLIITLLVVLIFVKESFFIVSEGEQVIVLKMGEISRVIKESGINYKNPFIEQVARFENRIIDLKVSNKKVKTLDGVEVIIDAFLKFRIVDSEKFYNKFVLSEEKLKNEIGNIVEGYIDNIVVNNNLKDVLLADYEDDKNNIGIKVVDFAITNINFPEENLNDIYGMIKNKKSIEIENIKIENENVVNNLKKDIAEESNKIINEAKIKAGKIEGEGDLEAAKIINNNFGNDSEFYNLYKKIEFYKNLSKENKEKIVINFK